MNTRHAKPESPLRQERYASSQEHETGLLANLVAKRCQALDSLDDSAKDRELIWMLQFHSWQKGGLRKLAAELLEKFGDRIGTRSMRRFGKASGNYNSDEVKAVRRELWAFDDFPLSGETKNAGKDLDDWGCPTKPPVEHPSSYPVAAFIERCETLAQNLSGDLTRLCLDPNFNFSSICYFHDLKECLALHQSAKPTAFAQTALSRAIWNEIADVHEMGGTVLLHNSAGNGKSFSAQAYCDANPGVARYVATPATNDEVSFMREIAKALGSASGLNFKSIYIRERILQTLLSGDLVLVIDSAQWLFPVSDYRYALPNRINWVLSALSEQGVPVVLIGDSKLFDAVGLVEARTGWNRSKLVNQLSRVVDLPEALEKDDVLTVAKAILPDGDKAAQRKLADYMIVAPGYLHSGKPAALRARRIAASARREAVTLADMEAALETFMKPSFKALESGLHRADSAASKCKAKVRNWRPDTEAQIAAGKGGKRRNAIVTSSDLKPGADEPAQASPRRHEFSQAETRRANLTGHELVPA